MCPFCNQYTDFNIANLISRFNFNEVYDKQRYNIFCVSINIYIIVLYMFYLVYKEKTIYRDTH